MTKILESINQFVWGIPTLLLILGVGIYLSIRTGFAQVTLFPKAIRQFFLRFRRGDSGEQGTSSYRALCTALAATVGTGNLAGVSGAIAIGGPGAVFWMWVCAFFGMVIKYAEALLCVRYRVRNGRGEFTGGPMYMIQNGLPSSYRWLGTVYCFLGVVAAFGVGNATQINTVIGSIKGVLVSFGGTPSDMLSLCLGILLALLIGWILLGGAGKIGIMAETLVPFASVLYLVLGFGVLTCRMSTIPTAFLSIVKGAFCPSAVTGGVIGSAFSALRIGASRGVFTNEAGMGTAGIAHSAARVSHPADQGLMGIIEVFLDTIVICTMTALVILCSGISIPYGEDVGIALTLEAFSAVYGRWIILPLCLAICCFAIATILGWGLYGTRCAEYLFGDRAWKPFVVLQVATVLLGAVLKTGTVWVMSELVNGLMAIPNLIGLAALSPQLIQLTKKYIETTGSKSAVGGTYENFNQCKPVRTFTHEKVSPVGCESKISRKKDISFEYWTAGSGNAKGFL